MKNLLITPGVWRVVYGDMIVSSDHPIEKGYIAETGNSLFWKGDATLIAAAPDLYRALDLCLEQLLFSEGGEPLSFRAAIVEAKQALAKARGES